MLPTDSPPAGWRVAVPTFHRRDLLSRRTLPLLLDHGVPADRITVYAGDDDQYQLPAGVGLRRVPAGLANASNAITDDHDPGAAVVRCDDDLRQVLQLVDGRLVPVPRLDGLFSAAFAALRHERLTLWGVYPVANTLFMDGRWSVGLWFAMGTLFGYLNVPGIRSTLAVKNDYERSLQHYVRAGGTLRLHDITFRAEPMRRAAGGIQADMATRRQREAAAIGSLMDRWPGLVHLKKSRDGFPEIALRLPKRVPSRSAK